MLRPVYIQRFFAGLMILVFAFGITPKRTLHHVFAKHTDSSAPKNTHGFPYQLSTAGYNCDNDNLVAESNFMGAQSSFSIPSFNSFSSYIVKEISFSSVPVIYSSLRGPPAII